MIEVTVTRQDFRSDRTLGTLTVNDGDKLLYKCQTLEDTLRGNGDPKTVKDWKIPSDTAIPYGRYTMRLLPSPSHQNQMYWRLEDVPGFEGILIHIGNTPKDTRGCILVGVSFGLNYDLINSTRAFENFMNTLRDVKVCSINITHT